VLFEGEDVQQLIDLHEKILKTNNVATPQDEHWNGSRWFRLFYITKSGRLIQREYDVPLCDKTLDFYQAAEDLFNSPAARKARGFNAENLTPSWFEYCSINVSSNGGKDIALTQQEAYDFYKTCVEPDLAEGKLDRCWILEDSVYKQTEYYNVHIDLNIRSPHPDEQNKPHGGYEYLHLRPTTESTRINNWLKARGVELLVADVDEREQKFFYPETFTSFPEDMGSIEITAEVTKELVSSSF
jgi:hypothetical protein